MLLEKEICCLKGKNLGKTKQISAAISNKPLLKNLKISDDTLAKKML